MSTGSDYQQVNSETPDQRRTMDNTTENRGLNPLFSFTKLDRNVDMTEMMEAEAVLAISTATAD